MIELVGTVLTAWFVGAGTVAPPDPKPVVAAERAFAARCKEMGIRNGFMHFAAEAGMIFRPAPTQARAFYQGIKNPAVSLLWTPRDAEISRAGDLGYTTGPWRLEADGKPPLFGHYVTVWQRQGDGTWRYLADIGVSHGAHADGFPSSVNARGHGAVASSPEVSKMALQNVDARVGGGDLAAYRELFAEDVIFMRDRRTPFRGAASAAKAVEERDCGWQWTAGGSAVAASGELGFVWGTGTRSVAEKRSYMRIWRHEKNGGWRLVLDIGLDIPKPKGK